ncbi:MAG: hypothetical protein WB870_05155 [Gallionellaceae bacterium]
MLHEINQPGPAVTLFLSINPTKLYYLPGPRLLQLKPRVTDMILVYLHCLLSCGSTTLTQLLDSYPDYTVANMRPSGNRIISAMYRLKRFVGFLKQTGWSLWLT